VGAEGKAVTMLAKRYEEAKNVLTSNRVHQIQKDATHRRQKVYSHQIVSRIVSEMRFSFSITILLNE
jgi:hypothetical protein